MRESNTQLYLLASIAAQCLNVIFILIRTRSLAKHGTTQSLASSFLETCFDRVSRAPKYISKDPDPETSDATDCCNNCPLY